MGWLLSLVSFLFWPIIAVLGIFALAAIENHKTGWLTIIVIASLLLIQFATPVDFVAIWNANPWFIVGAVVAYLATGVVWASIRWFLFTVRAKELYTTLRKKAIEKGITIETQYNSDWYRFLQSQNYSKKFGHNIPPSPNEHKAAIAAALMGWPLDSIWTILNDPVRRMFRLIFNGIRGFFTNISAAQFKNFDEFKD